MLAKATFLLVEEWAYGGQVVMAIDIWHLKQQGYGAESNINKDGWKEML